jgi:hypothetical protein
VIFDSCNFAAARTRKKNASKSLVLAPVTDKSLTTDGCRATRSCERLNLDLDSWIERKWVNNNTNIGICIIRFIMLFSETI